MLTYDTGKRKVNLIDVIKKVEKKEELNSSESKGYINCN